MTSWTDKLNEFGCGELFTADEDAVGGNPFDNKEWAPVAADKSAVLVADRGLWRGGGYPPRPFTAQRLLLEGATLWIGLAGRAAGGDHRYRSGLIGLDLPAGRIRSFRHGEIDGERQTVACGIPAGDGSVLAGLVL